MATNLYRVPSSTGSQTKFTFSFWWKNNCNHGSDKCFFSSGLNSSNYFMIRTTGNEQLELLALDNGSATMRYKPTRYYRDNNAFYHIVIAVDTTQSGGNRLKWYTNGVRETAFDLSTEPNQNTNLLYINDTTTHAIGRKNVTQDKYFQGTLSHYHFTDGYVYDASAFGSTDSVTGEWQINTSPSVTYGTNGFFILKDGNSVTDQSGNGNNFTVGGGTLTKTEDCPSNVFATLNPLVTYGTNQNALSQGNNTLTGIAYHRPSPPTIAVNKGKWYFEAKALSGTSSKWWIGLCDTDYDTNNQGATGSTANYIWGYDNTTNAVNQRSQCIYDVNLRDGGGNISISNIFSAPSVNDIYAMAVDLDNQKVWYAKNGVWNNGSASQSTTFNASYPDSTNIDADRFYYIGVGGENSKWSINYGNGYFGTTAVSSAGTNASGNGIFEYDVPTGYTALSTKGLNL